MKSTLRLARRARIRTLCAAAVVGAALTCVVPAQAATEDEAQAAVAAMASHAGAGEVAQGTPQELPRSLGRGLDAVTSSAGLIDAVGDSSYATDLQSMVAFTSDDGRYSVGITLDSNALIEGDYVVTYVNTDGNPGTGEPTFGGADLVVFIVGHAGQDGVTTLRWNGATFVGVSYPSLISFGSGATDEVWSISAAELGIAPGTPTTLVFATEYEGAYDNYFDFAPEPGGPAFTFTTAGAVAPPPVAPTPVAAAPVAPAPVAFVPITPGRGVSAVAPTAPLTIRSFAVTRAPGALTFRLGWVKGSGSVVWYVRLTARIDGRRVTRTVRGFGSAGTRTIGRAVALPRTWTGASVSVDLDRQRAADSDPSSPRHVVIATPRMNRCGITVLLACVAASGSSAAGAHASVAGVEHDATVVGVEAGPSRADLVRSLQSAGAVVVPLSGLEAIVVRGGRSDAIARAIHRSSAVAYTEPVLSRHVLGDPAEAVDPATGRSFSWAFDAVDAAAGIAQAGGGAPTSPIGVVDSGVDASQPDLVGRLLPGVDVLGEGTVADLVGHGTFVTGLINAVDGNGIGGRGVAGATPVIPVRVSTDGDISSVDLAAGIVAAVYHGARVINISIGGEGLAAVEVAAIDYARRHDVLLVASAGNSGEDGDPVEYPAAAIGGDRGSWSDGLSVAATDPSGRPAPFSTHNDAVSIAAPGAGAGACTDGVYSTLPTGAASLWPGGACDRIITTQGAGRYAYGQGTSFSAPLVAGAAALVRQVSPGLRADQVGDVLRRSARQTIGSGWNPGTGAGVLDIGAATALAARYDATAPELSLSAEAGTGTVRIRANAEDRVGAGHDVAGDATVGAEYSRDGFSFAPLIAPGPAPIDASYAASAAQPLWIAVTACDRNRNCVRRVQGPLTGAAPRPVAATASVTPRGRPAFIGLDVRRRCAHAAHPCLRVVWTSGPSTAGRLRYVIEATRVGGHGLVARTSGSAAPHHRIARDLIIRRPLACGRLEVRIVVRSPGVRRVLVRRVAIRNECRPDGARNR